MIEDNEEMEEPLEDYAEELGVGDEDEESPTRERKKKHPAVLRANIPGLIDLVDDHGVPAFMVSGDDSLEAIRSLHEVTPEGERITIQPPGYEHLPFPLVNGEAVEVYYQAGTDNALFDDILRYLKRFSYLTDEQFLVCALYVYLTYLQDHPDIQYLPMLLFYAVPERGKTRTGKALTYISFRGVHCVDLRETNLFRYSQELRATLFLDIMDMWKKAQRNQSEDVLLLRYEKGATVARVLYPEKGAFKDTKYFAVYGPTLMASNEPIHKILDSRCITFQMPNKPGYYLNPKPADGLILKARLTAWKARNMTASLPAVEPIEGISGRLWDICQPLFQICLMVAPKKYEDLIEAILNIATERKQEKQSSDDGKIVQILMDLSPDDLYEWDISTNSITEEFNKDRKPEWHKTDHWMGRKLRALGIKTRIVGGYSRTFLNQDILLTLTEQYGLLAPPESHESHESSQEPKFMNDLFHDIQHDFQTGKSKSCPKSCSQVAEGIEERDIHDIHDSDTEEEIIDICNGIEKKVEV